MIRVETIECYFLTGADRESPSYTTFIKRQWSHRLPGAGAEKGRAGLLKMQTPGPCPRSDNSLCR